MSRQSHRSGELELLPVMNLVTILIPMLLLGAQLANLGIVESELPSISDEPSGAPPAPLALTVAITGAGFTVLGADGVLHHPDGDGPGATVPCHAACQAAEDYDYAELSRLLALVKDEFPDELHVVLSPDGDVSYGVLVGTMDATRAHGDRPLFPQVSVAGGSRDG